MCDITTDNTDRLEKTEVLVIALFGDGVDGKMAGDAVGGRAPPHKRLFKLYFTHLHPVVKVVLRSRGGGGSPDEARLEQTPYPFQSH